MDTAAERRRLRWQCRRGMLELDLLLQGFLDSGFEELPEQLKRAFIALLAYPDDALLEWLMGRVVPADQDIADVVERIRAHPLS